jgi:hypothetical protein
MSLIDSKDYALGAVGAALEEAERGKESARTTAARLEQVAKLCEHWLQRCLRAEAKLDGRMDDMLVIPQDITDKMEVALKLVGCSRDMVPESVWLEASNALGGYQGWKEAERCDHE